MKFIVTADHHGKRLDRYLTLVATEHSRSTLRKMIKANWVNINREIAKAHTPVKTNDAVYLSIPKNTANPKIKPKKITLDIVYEDPHFLIVNKPAGMLTHPTKFAESDTLVNALLSYTQLSSGSDLTRPGIIHRLDRDTSGLLLVAKTDKIHRSLARQMEERRIKKTYISLVAGKLSPRSGTIEAPLLKTRGPKNEGLTIVSPNDKAKMSITHYTVIDYPSDKFSLLEIDLETGRTHQIRVHLSAIGYPVVGDELYGSKSVNAELSQLGLTRQFLHAQKLIFTHPVSKKKVEVTAELTDDLKKVLTNLK